MSRLKRLDLLLREIKDPAAQENFWRLKQWLEAQVYSVPDQITTIINGGSGGSGGGGSGSNNFDVSVTADETISATRVVYSVGGGRVRLAQPNILDKTRIYGLAITTAVTNNPLTIRLEGTYTDAAFSGMTLNGSVFLGVNGVMTQSIPATANSWAVRLGTYIGDNTIRLDFEEAIKIIA